MEKYDFNKFANHTSACCIFSEHLFIRAPLYGCFCDLIEMICFTLPILQVCNFANNLTFHACDNDFNTLIMRLENDVSLTINWFENSSTKINKSKCHILASGHKYGNFGVKMGNAKQKSLGVEIGRNLNFDDHVPSLYKKAGRKLQKQPTRGVLGKTIREICSQFTGEHHCRSVISEIALRHGCSPLSLLHIFRTPFPKNTSGRLLLKLAVLARLSSL